MWFEVAKYIPGLVKQSCMCYLLWISVLAHTVQLREAVYNCIKATFLETNGDYTLYYPILFCLIS